MVSSAGWNSSWSPVLEKHLLKHARNCWCWSCHVPSTVALNPPAPPCISSPLVNGKAPPSCLLEFVSGRRSPGSLKMEGGEPLDLNEFVREQGGERDDEDLETRERSQQYTPEEWEEWNSWWWGWQYDAWGSRGVYSTSCELGASTAAPAEMQQSMGDSGARRQQTDPWEGRHDPWSQWSSDAWWKGASSGSRGDFSDPPSWSGWSHYRLWKKAILRWDASTDVKYWRRSEKLLKSMDWDLQSHFEHVPDHQLQGPDYLTHIFGILDVLAGEKESTEMRRSVRAALYEGTRRSDESLAQYSLRREAQFSTASRYLSIPDELKGFMLEEQSGLSRQGLQSLRVLTGGDSSYDMVRKALKIMDIDEEAICKGKPHSYFQEFVERDLPDDRYVLEGDEVLDDEDILNAEEVSDVFFAIQQMDLDEDRAMTFLGDWQKRKRSWSENKQLKNAMKKTGGTSTTLLRDRQGQQTALAVGRETLPSSRRSQDAQTAENAAIGRPNALSRTSPRSRGHWTPSRTSGPPLASQDNIFWPTMATPWTATSRFLRVLPSSILEPLRTWSGRRPFEHFKSAWLPRAWGPLC